MELKDYSLEELKNEIRRREKEARHNAQHHCAECKHYRMGKTNKRQSYYTETHVCYMKPKHPEWGEGYYYVANFRGPACELFEPVDNPYVREDC